LQHFRQPLFTDEKPPFPEKCSRRAPLCDKLARMTLLVQGFLLGLANGASCLTTCAPVLLPYLVGEGRTVRRNALPVLYFLGGRLAGYLIFAVFAWEAGQWIRSSPRGGLIFGAVYATLAIVLVIYGFSSPANTCAAGSMGGRLAAITSRWPALLPALMGLLTGLSLCPPFLAALAGATSQATLFSSLLFFSAFFIATSLYVTPFPLAGLIGRSQAIRITGRLAAGVMGIYYFYRGLLMIYGGLQS
jgi:hypothetical protein